LLVGTAVALVVVAADIALHPRTLDDTAAMTAIEHGDLLTLRLVTVTTPAILDHPLIVAVLALADDDEDTARDAIEALVNQPGPTQRHAAVIRVRALAHHQPISPPPPTTSATTNAMSAEKRSRCDRSL
jgi:hypothetical protein